MPILGIYASQISGHLTPPWSPEGAYDSLATVTVPAGGVASVTFTGIPTGYEHLQIRILKRNGAVGWITGRINNDSGTNYTYHELRGDGSSATANSGAGADIMYMSLADNTVGGMIVDILDYSNTNKNKTLRTLSGSDANGSGFVQLVSNLWLSTAPITSITFFFPTWLENSSFALYGVK